MGPRIGYVCAFELVLRSFFRMVKVLLNLNLSPTGLWERSCLPECSRIPQIQNICILQKSTGLRKVWTYPISMRGVLMSKAPYSVLWNFILEHISHILSVINRLNYVLPLFCVRVELYKYDIYLQKIKWYLQKKKKRLKKHVRPHGEEEKKRKCLFKPVWFQVN